jgi:hypothetical protein
MTAARPWSWVEMPVMRTWSAVTLYWRSVSAIAARRRAPRTVPESGVDDDEEALVGVGRKKVDGTPGKADVVVTLYAGVVATTEGPAGGAGEEGEEEPPPDPASPPARPATRATRASTARRTTGERPQGPMGTKRAPDFLPAAACAAPLVVVFAAASEPGAGDAMGLSKLKSTSSASTAAAAPPEEEADEGRCLGCEDPCSPTCAFLPEAMTILMCGLAAAGTFAALPVAPSVVTPGKATRADAFAAAEEEETDAEEEEPLSTSSGDAPGGSILPARRGGTCALAGEGQGRGARGEGRGCCFVGREGEK